MIKECKNCKRKEDYEGQFDCEDWNEDQVVILCDDCFFNDLYNKEKTNEKKQLVSNIKKLSIKEIEQIIVILQKHVLDYMFPKDKKGERKKRDD